MSGLLLGVTKMMWHSSICAVAALGIVCSLSPAHATDQEDAAALAALAILGVAAMTHHSDHYRPDHEPKTAEEKAQFERGYRDGLHNEAYDSRHSSVMYGQGFDAGHKERSNRLAHKRHSNSDATLPDGKAARACVGEASAEWGRDPRDIHVVDREKGAFSQASGQEIRIELAAGHKHGVCTVDHKGTVFGIEKGHL